MRSLKLIAAILMMCGCSFAANHCVCATATCASHGAANGSDWNNTFSTMPASLVRGDTYYVAGGSYGSLTLNDAGSTTITIVHATAASHGPASGWSDSFATQAVWTDWSFAISAGHYIFDGVTGGGPGSWATGYGFKIQMPVSGGQADAVDWKGTGTLTSVEIHHVDIQGRGRSYAGGDTDLLYVTSTYNGITIDHCYMHDTDRTMILTWPSDGTNFTLEYTYLARNGTAEHREAWSSGDDKNVIVAYNLFEDILGTGFIAAVNSVGTASNYKIYGNVFYWTLNFADGVINTGIIVTRYDGGACDGVTSICILASGWEIKNNAFVNINRGVSGTVNCNMDLEGPIVSVVAQNNIFYNNNGAGAGNCGPGGTSTDYNWFFANTPGNATSGAHDQVGTASPFAAGSNPTFPILNWALIASIPGISQVSYTVDALGNAYAPNWDRGAYSFARTPPVVKGLRSKRSRYLKFGVN